MKPTPPQTPQQQQQECHLDDLGYCFVKKCIENIESRGLNDQGLYRIGGVSSRVARLLQVCLDRKNYNTSTGKVSMPDFSDSVEWETKTITSALKHYLRNLSEPLLTYNLHPMIIEAAKIEEPEARKNRIKSLIQQLPITNFTLLKKLVEHLRNVASHSKENRMTVSNLGICFAPTLMRGPDENTLSLMEIKYSNVVATTLIEHYDSIFNDPCLNQPRHLQNMPNNNKNHQMINQPIHYVTNTNTQVPTHSNNNHDDHFGLSLPNAQYQNQMPTVNSVPYHYPMNNSNMNVLPYQYYNSVNAALNQNYQYYPIHSNKLPSNKVVTLYACVADTESELSFGPNEIVTDVTSSAEAHWLVGTLERTGIRGLVPENYVMFI